jgi:hypothetical protein
MDFLPDICQVPYILRERNIEPVDFYTEMQWSKQQYNAYAKNRTCMSAGTIKTVAEYFGLPMDDIYTWKLIEPRRGTGNKQSRK